MTDRHRRWTIGVVGVAVVVTGLAAEWVAHAPRLDFGALRDLLTGWALAASGLVAWATVPRSRVGPLLAAAGATWFIWNASTVGAVGPIAAALTDLCAGFLAHALFTWPSGRAVRPLDRVFVIGGYVVALLPPLWERDASLLIVSGLLAAALLVQHAASPPSTRRLRRPALLLGLALAAILAAKGTAAEMLRQADVAYPSASGDLWQLAVVLVALGLTWSLIALDRRRRSAADVVVRLETEQPTGAAGELLALTDLLGATGQPDDAAVADVVAQARDMGARNAALRNELAAQVVALEDSRRRLIEAADDERVALEERLRAGPAVRLSLLEETLSGLQPKVAGTAPEVAPHIGRALAQLRQARLELSELARGLDPALLRDRGLGAALLDLAERSHVPVSVSLAALGPSAPSAARTLYYVASEALANVAKHAAAAHAWLRLEAAPSGLTLTVEDDGIGTDGSRSGSGLHGLRDRLDVLDGSLVIGRRPGGGTSLKAIVPTPPDGMPRNG
jgi:signal transduction histidine kinase